MFEWKIYVFESYQKEVNDKNLESSDIQHTGPLAWYNLFVWAEHINDIQHLSLK